MGISFAIPIDEAIRVSDQLRTLGHVQRGKLGIQIEQVSKDLAESLGLGKAQGALVRSVETGSPAEKAGLEPGDVVLKLDGKVIERSIDLPRLVGIIKPGTKALLSVWRRGANKEVAVTVGEFEADAPVAAKASKDKPAAGNALASLGLTLSDLSEEQKKEFKVSAGVRVEQAVEAAAQAGLREGDIITALANTDVTSVKGFEAILSRLDKTRPTNILFRRGAWAQFAIIRPSAKEATTLPRQLKAHSGGRERLPKGTGQLTPYRSRIWGQIHLKHTTQRNIFLFLKPPGDPPLMEDDLKRMVFYYCIS